MTYISQHLMILTHLAFCVFLVFLILLQKGRGADLTNSATGSAFVGAQKINIFVKATVLIAVLFFGSSFYLAR